MKMFRWLAAGAMVILLAALVLSRAGRSRPAPLSGSAVAPAATVADAANPSAAPAAGLFASVTTPSPAVPAPSPAADSTRPFENWVRAYAQGDAAQRAALLEQTSEITKARRAEMAALIRSNPEEALRRALPYSLRQQLPDTFLLQIEQPVSARGEFRPVCYKPYHLTGHEGHDLGYEVFINGTRFETYTYGARLAQPAHESIYLHGVSVLDDGKKRDVLALADEPARVITDDQEKQWITQNHTLVGGACEPGRQTVVQFGDQYYSYCDPAEVDQLNEMLKAAHGRLWGSGAKNHASENLPIQGFSGTQGIKKLLYIRVLFADDPAPPQSDNGAQATTRANNEYFHEGSYGTVWWESTITPLVRLPERKTFYGENPGRLLGDAAAGAALLGYFTQDYYSPHYVLHNTLVQYDFGGLSSGILNASPGALTHELGHNFGLPHANLWTAEGTQPGPVQPANQPPWPIDPDSLIGHYDINAPAVIGAGDQPVLEYGNQHDVMGGGGGHFSAKFKSAMDWLPDPYIKRITGSTTNRLHAFDVPRITPGRIYAMRMQKNLQREYWFSLRQEFSNNPWFANGLEVTWNIGTVNPGYGTSLGNNVLLDTTADTTFAREDAALTVGRTLHDPQASLHVTPVAIGGAGVERWIDVVVQIGPFPGNQAPTLALAADTLSVPVGGTVNFTANAQDADGDALAYHWDFGDWAFGTNGPVQSKQFNATGQFVVRCEVSDMKGGVASRHVVVIVGTPTTYMISGRVLDTEGQPVQGVRVHNSGTRPDVEGAPPFNIIGSANPFPGSVGTYRYGYTDTDGYYAIGNVPPDNYSARAFIFGWSTVPLNFSDPVDVSNGSANNIDFTATKIARVRIERTRDAEEPGGEGGEGLFTITREGGDFTQDLPVRFSLGGSAAYTVNYNLAGVNTLVTNCTFTTNGNVITTNCVTSNVANGQIVIPAFVSSVDVQVLPVDNAVGDGDKTVLMSLTLQTNFFRTVTMITNILTTNGSVIVTNSVFTNRVFQFRVPGWELRNTGVPATPTWYQTDPTYVLDQAEATVIINDDDPPALPAIGVLSLDTDALESREDTATLVITRTGAPLDSDLTVHYDLTGFTPEGVAVNGEDYEELPGSITIPAGQNFALLTIRAVNDLFVEGNEEVLLEILPSPGNYITPEFGAFGFAIIVDDDLPLVNAFAAVSTVPRNGGAARVTVSRAGSTDLPLTVNYLVTGTAQSGVDFNTLNGSVVIPAGQLNANIDITPIASSPNPLPRTVTIQLSDAPTYNIYQQNSATITIFDNNLPTITLSRSAAAISENAGTAFFTVTRTGSTAASLNVFFEVGGTAWEGSDYASIGTNIVIPAGAASANINILGLDDPAREVGDVTGADTIIVRVREHATYNLGGTVSQTMTITDNEGDTALPSVGFMLASSTVPEDVGVANLYVRVTANPATNRPIQMEYRVTAGTAVPGINYLNAFPDGGTPVSFTTTGILNITHYFPPRPPPQFFSFENGIYAIPVQILDDGLASGDKTLTITLFDPTRFVTNRSLATNTSVTPNQIFTNFLITPIATNAYRGPVASHTITIKDLRTSTVTVTALDQRAYEAGPAAARFQFTRTGSTNSALTVAFALEGTAAFGSDYALLGGGVTNGTVTIPAGTNSVIVSLVPIDDPIEEIAESVILRLLKRAGYHANPAGAASTLIVSDDGTIQFSFESYRVSEDGSNGVISVVRTGGTNLTTTVEYLFTGGTALNGTDYVGANGALTFPPGSTVQNITVPLIDDLLVEADETVFLVLSNATGGVPLGGQNTATLFIVNDDTAFEFAAASFRGNENGVIGSVDIRRLGVLTNTDSVTFTSTNGTADAADFFASTFPVTFLPGETNQTVNVFIQDDAIFEGDETVALVLSDPAPGATLGAFSNATLVIVDDECQLEFEVAGYSVIEYSNFVTLVVRRVGGTVNPVAVTYTTADGTATNDLDYAAVSTQVTFTGDRFELDTNGSGALSFVPGQSSRTVTVPILDDVLGEGNETFTVTLSAAQTLTNTALPGATLLGTNTTTTVTILDNELPGNVDYEFDSGAGANATVRAVAQSPRGGLVEFLDRVVIGGDFTTVDNFVFNRVARLLPDGSLDSAFNPGAGANGPVHAVAVQPDGRVIAGGEFTTMNNTNRARLARLNGDGKLDLGFNPGTNGVNGTVRAVLLQPDGRVIIGGDFSQVGGVPRGFVARLETNGVPDTNFVANVSGSVHALALQADGRLLIGGAFTFVDGVARASLARLHTNGVLDTTLAIGSGFNGPVHALAALPDGRILAGGSFSNYNTTNISFLVRLTAAGVLDTTFKSGTGPDGAVFSIAPAAAGRVVIGGAFLHYNDVPRAGFARLTPNGGVDRNFDTGTGANAPVRAVVAQENTALIIGGDFTVVNGLPRNRVARIHGDEFLDLVGVEFIASEFTVSEAGGAIATITVQRTGSTNRAFNVEYYTADQTATAPDDYLSASGAFAFASGEMTKTFEVTVFDDELAEGNETVRLILTNASALVELSDLSRATLVILDSARSVFFGATEYTVNEFETNAAVTLVRAGSLDGDITITLRTENITAAAGYDYAGFTNLITFTNGEALKVVALPLISNDGEPEFTETLRLRLTAGSVGAAVPNTAVLSIVDDDPGAGFADVRFDPGAGAARFVRALALQPDGRLLVGGAFTNFASSNLNYLARLDTNGLVDATFTPGSGPNALVSAIGLTPEGHITAAGNFSIYNGASYNRLVRLRTNGTVDPVFTGSVPFDSALHAAAVQADGRVIVGGAFKAPAAGVVRVRPNSSLDLQFNPGLGADGAVHAVALLPDGKVMIGGGFTNVAGTPRPRLARLGADGTFDVTYPSAGITNGSIFALAVGLDGKLVIGGSFHSVQGVARAGIARLHPDGALDLSFNPGAGVTGTVYTVSVLTNGAVFIGGDFLSVNGFPRGRYALLTASGAVDAGFDSALGADNTVFASLVTADQKIMIGGDFTTVGGAARRGVARLNVGGQQTLRFTRAAVAGNSAVLEINTVPGSAYILEGSDDFAVWLPFTTNLATGVTLEISEPGVSGREQRFYRARRFGP